MRRVVRLIAVAAAVQMAGCADPQIAGLEQSSPRLAYLPGNETLPTDLIPSRGEVAGFGGSLIGKLAAGAPGGAVLGLSGQLAGGNGVGKAAGSTLGGLLGSVLGPLGSVIGSLVGGYVGDQPNSSENSLAAAEPGPGYIDALDLGPSREKAS